MKFTQIIVGTAALAFLAAPVVNAADKQSDQLDKVPTKVKEALLKEANGGTVTDIDKETKNGVVCYEAELKQGDKKWDVHVREDGTIFEPDLKNEELAALPEKVRATLDKERANGEVKDIDRKVDNGTVYYKVNIKTATGDSRKLSIAEDGTIIKEH
jgi:uncharacterized membrane protein YkoI